MPRVSSNLFNILTQYLLQVNNDDDVRALFKQVQGEVPGSPIFIMRLASQVRLLCKLHFSKHVVPELYIIRPEASFALPCRLEMYSVTCTHILNCVLILIFFFSFVESTS